MKRGLDHSQVVFRIATLLLLCFNNHCVAAGAGPALTFDALLKGYGIVAVTGIRAAPREERAYQVRFKVHQVAAQPAINGPLTLNPGDEMDLVVTVGRGGTLSYFGLGEPPVEGAKYYLTVAFNPATGTYSTAIGALSLRQVTEFTEDDLLMFRRIGKLAGAPITERSTLAIQMLEDPASNTETKINCLSALRRAADPETPDSDKQTAIKSLRRAWNQATAVQDSQVTDSIDATLGVIDPEFTPLSDVRIDGWLRIIFLPFEHRNGEALTSEMRNRWNLARKLADFGDDPPEKVTRRILLDLSRASSPLEFRVRLAGVLQRLYLTARTPDPQWAAVLNDFYPAALGQANSSDLSLIANALAISNEISATSTQRRFEPSDKTVAAIQASLQRMRALAASHPNDPRALSAIAGLERALGARKE